MSSCEFHGYDGLSCPLCRAERIATEADALKEGRAVYGVFPHRGDGAYKIENAIRTFKSRFFAERHADKLNAAPYPEEAPRGYVTRFVYK